MILDTTGTIGTRYARQQPSRYIEPEKRQKTEKEKKNDKLNYLQGKQKYPEKLYEDSKGRPKRGRKNIPSLRQGGHATKPCPPEEMRQAMVAKRTNRQTTTEGSATKNGLATRQGNQEIFACKTEKKENKTKTQPNHVRSSRRSFVVRAA